MKNINVLIVDDQINVVSGVMFGVHWDRLGISQIYKAYNAYEAKQVLLEKPVVSCCATLKCRWKMG